MECLCVCLCMQACVKFMCLCRCVIFLQHRHNPIYTHTMIIHQCLKVLIFRKILLLERIYCLRWIVTRNSGTSLDIGRLVGRCRENCSGKPFWLKSLKIDLKFVANKLEERITIRAIILLCLWLAYGSAKIIPLLSSSGGHDVVDPIHDERFCLGFSKLSCCQDQQPFLALQLQY